MGPSEGWARELRLADSTVEVLVANRRQSCCTVCGFNRSKQACLLGKLLAAVI